MIKHRTTAKRSRTARLAQRALAEVIGGTNGTIIVENGVGGTGAIAAPPIGEHGISGGAHI